MLFYQIEGVDTDYCEENDERENEMAFRRKIRKMSQRAQDFFNLKQRKGFYFLSSSNENIITLGAMTNGAIDMEEFHAFLRVIGLNLSDIEVKEAVFQCVSHMLSTSDRRGYIDDADDVLNRYGLIRLSDNRFFQFGERLIEDSNREKITEESKKYIIDESFKPELERIYSGKKKTASYGHPVHYFVETDNNDLRKKIYGLLLQALYDNGRIKSRRYSFIDLDPTEEFRDYCVDTLYSSCIGGTVVMRYTQKCDSSDEEFASSGQRMIEKACEIIKRYRNQVLTVFCLPRECKRLKDIITSELGSISMVEVKEEFAEGEKAEGYLRELAKENAVRTDKSLFACIQEGEKYLAPDLQAMFDEWYNNKLKTSIYPQYAQIATVKKESIKSGPKGDAFEELQEMIGLEEAKKVINKALSFYKVQKLYKEMDIQQDRLAMHMVFSGNPGTAKTSVARLFARIMADNGLLSTGTLVECGRSDIIAKYVGHTAKNVKELFNRARGGVLFIDECYSLLDDRSGSFGDEAINTIVQEMENLRDEVVVIMGGYGDKMEEFLNRNPGLRSRIAFHVPFSDYDTEELCEIADLLSSKKGLTLTEDAKEKLHSIFAEAKQQKDFGNGRYVRNVLEQSRMTQAERILSLDYDKVTPDIITTITGDDITKVRVSQRPQKKSIGFSIGAAS